jgi:carotenoid 1,2-hydratase
MAVHGPGGRRSMTERGARSVRRDAATLEVGSSRMIWEDGALAVDIDEIAVPHLSRLRGKMRLTPDFVTDREAALSPEGGHVRRPFAPAARVGAEMASPRQSWSGHGYLDANFGNRPLEAGCRRWTRSRARGAQGATVLYDAERRGGSALQLSGRFALGPVRARAGLRSGRFALGPVRAGRGLERAAPPPGRPPARRLLAHGARDALRRRIDAADRRRGSPPQIATKMEDAPLYARAGLLSRLWGEDVEWMHEAIDLDRRDTRWRRALLPFRMPRRG